MSGIAAALRLDGSPVDPALAGRMVDALAHRGGDANTTWRDGPATLGAAVRVATTESVGEAQPLVDAATGAVLALDGYLANFDELTVELGAGSDSALVLAAYRRWGDRFAEHLDGEFAAILWDPRRRALFALRDPIGNRPLSWHCDGKTLLVASEHSAILTALPQRPEPNRAYLVQVLADTFLCAEDTPWEGIRRVSAAHVLRAESGAVREDRYWEPDLDAKIVLAHDADYEAEYRDLLFECTRRAARSHRTTAFQVSGGLDSSALFCIADRLAESRSLPAPGMAGYALATPPGSEADEDRYVTSVERQTGRSIARVPLTLPSLASFSAEAERTMDLPPNPNTVMADGLTDAAVAAGSRVIVSGLGGDNWLDGQPLYYGEDLAAGRFSAVLSSFLRDRNEIGTHAAASRLVRNAIVRFAPEPVTDFLRTLAGRGRPDTVEALEWLSRDALALLRERHERRAAFLAAYPRHLRYKMAKLTSPEFLHGLAVVEGRVAGRGAELRSPMFGKAFISFSLATPERLRRQGDRYKLIHRRSLVGIVPGDVLERRDKAYFDLTYHRLFDDIAGPATAPLPPHLAALVDDPRHASSLVKGARLLDDPPIRPLWSFHAAIVLARLFRNDAHAA